MAIAAMAKVVIVTHRSQSQELLEALQKQGICQILNAEEAMVSRDRPELCAVAERPKDLEQVLNRLEKSITFLKDYATLQKDFGGVLASALAPRAVIDEDLYSKTVSDKATRKIVERCEQIASAMDKLESQRESLNTTLDMLAPWAVLETPVEEISQLSQATAIAGLIPTTHFEQVQQQLDELGAAVQQVSTTNNKRACLVVCLKEKTAEVQKLLRSADCEQVSFEHVTGTAAELIEQHGEELKDTTEQLAVEKGNAEVLAKELLKLRILYDHNKNLLDREQTRSTAPSTECTVILEGWVRRKDLGQLEKTVGTFDASSMTTVEPGEDEEIPVEIENNKAIRPFEVITRLYGMPMHFEVDPTVFLAPFFALFFGLCLTDAGYGVVLMVLSIWLIKKMQGDKKLLWMLVVCSAGTVLAGALTGGWFGDAVQQFIPSLGPVRDKMIWFDPIKKPMMFFNLSLILGYIHIMTGLIIAFVHNLKRGKIIAAIFDQLTWLVMLNSVAILIFVGGKPGRVCGYVALFPAVMILLFSEREGGWGGRLGMGLYNLFSAIFYMGDVLSYLRLMALGMVTGGLAMAINVIAKLISPIPFGIGIVLAILVFVCGHSVNLGLNALGAFVHTLRLQYAEFFPKFLVGGGKLFEPLAKRYEYVYLKKSEGGS